MRAFLTHSPARRVSIHDVLSYTIYLFLFFLPCIARHTCIRCHLRRGRNFDETFSWGYRVGQHLPVCAATKSARRGVCPHWALLRTVRSAREYHSRVPQHVDKGDASFKRRESGARTAVLFPLSFSASGDLLSAPSSVCVIER